METDKKDREWEQKRHPEFRPQDLEEGHVIFDSDRGYNVIMVSPHHFIMPDGTHVTEI